MKNESRITVIIPYKTYPPKTGGQKFNAFVYQYLSKLIPVTIISTKNNEQPLNTDGTFLPVLGNSRLRYINPFLFFTIRKIVKGNNTTHLTLIHPYFGWLGVLIKWTTNLKLVIHSHNIESQRFKSVGKWWWKILFFYEGFIHRNADFNFFVTEEDKAYAIDMYKVDPQTCHLLTYGIELDTIPTIHERSAAKKHVSDLYDIANNENILLFNGTLDYRPNLDAIDNILKHINPRLLSMRDFNYKLIICGKGLPGKYEGLKKYKDQNIIYAGFVEDISIYFKAADVFLNPVVDGGGIKTKLVEAIGYNVSSVSTSSGAQGVPREIAQGKIVIVSNADWEGFSSAVEEIDIELNTSASFFDHFYWGNIAEKAVKILT